MLTSGPPTTPPPAGASARFVGAAPRDLLDGQPGRGRRRRWVYVAAADDEVLVGAAVVDVGLLGLGTTFVFAADAGGTYTWDAGPGRAGEVGGLAGHAHVERRRGRVTITPERLEVDVPVAGGRVVAELEVAATAPVTLLTATPRGGWNATTKAAGHRAHGRVVTPHGTHALDGGVWTDLTDGRQDAHTTWRWAAGAGRTTDGTRRVGLHASTGMNAAGPGEDVVWWDDTPAPLPVHTLEPADPAAPGGAWRLAGDGWALTLDPTGVRAAEEGIGPLRSSYTQPLGVWTGTLPGPDGAPVPVRLHGVAEDHEARW